MKEINRQIEETRRQAVARTMDHLAKRAQESIPSDVELARRTGRVIDGHLDNKVWGDCSPYVNPWEK